MSDIDFYPKHKLLFTLIEAVPQCTMIMSVMQLTVQSLNQAQCRHNGGGTGHIVYRNYGRPWRMRISFPTGDVENSLHNFASPR